MIATMLIASYFPGETRVADLDRGGPDACVGISIPLSFRGVFDEDSRAIPPPIASVAPGLRSSGSLAIARNDGRFARRMLAVFLFVSPAGVAFAQTPDQIASWLVDVDRSRNAFSEAVITARASQVTGGKVTGSADFEIYTKGEDKGLISNTLKSKASPEKISSSPIADEPLVFPFV